MEEWPSLFNSYENSGVFDITADSDREVIEKAAKQCGLDFLHIHMDNISDKKGLLERIAHALGFPEYFGENWDALHECLTDMAWNPATGYALFFSGASTFTEHRPDDMNIFREILKAAAHYWKQHKIPFFSIVSMD